ncbi:uncharacterized protein [Dermacentor andersoni]|uniref:uncharacterized protein n=1 Tax=Dermacentor andersoni TaxID=34620 RepID=UPI002417812C|nr:uncharacterized protein LOC129380734 [Dermacentor andersoni]
MFARYRILFIAGIGLAAHAPMLEAGPAILSELNVTMLLNPVLQAVDEGARVARQIPVYNRRIGFYPYGVRFGSPFASLTGAAAVPFGGLLGGPFGANIGSGIGAGYGYGGNLGGFLPIRGPTSSILVPQLVVGYQRPYLPFLVGIPYPVYIPVLPTTGAGIFPTDVGFDAATN